MREYICNYREYFGPSEVCARCFGTPRDCPGKGMARRCEAERGPKVEFIDYNYKLWEQIGYNPGQVELVEEINEEHSVQDGGLFTPIKLPTDPEKFGGVCVKMIPKEIDHAEVIEFLIGSGLSETNKDNISIKHNGTVIVSNLESSECEVLITAIHTKTFFGKRLYCNGVVPLSPDKPEEQREQQQQQQQQQHQHEQQQLIITTSESQVSGMSSTVTTTTSSTSTTVPVVPVPSPLSPMSPATFSQQYSETPDILNLQLTNDDLVRRNSLSLRSPPAGSLAREILSTGESSQDHPYNKAKSILSNLREMTERLSDFASADSASFSDDSDGGTDKDGFRVQDERKKSRKHKLSITPTRDFFLKRTNTACSPQQYFK